MEFSNEQKLYAEIVQKAWDDADFKRELVNNPVDAIEKITGKKMILPKGKKLVVRDQTDDSTVYINIHTRPTIDNELNEGQLDTIAGGIKGPDGCFPSPPWEPTPTFPSDIVFY